LKSVEKIDVNSLTYKCRELYKGSERGRQTAKQNNAARLKICACEMQALAG
jgi:hypothetical protein